MVYLGTPGNALQAHAVSGMPVLVSYAVRTKVGAWLDDYIPSYESLLIDSGAYSELNSGIAVDLAAYVAWAKATPCEAWAGLDDISGDWRRSLVNYEAGGFPTFHDTDPHELLDDLVPMARERGNWLGIGMLPPRTGREDWLRRTLDRIPEDLHVHVWAGGAYSHLAFDSFDSTNWWRDSWKVLNACPWLTPGEALEIVVKRGKRRVFETRPSSGQGDLW